MNDISKDLLNVLKKLSKEKIDSYWDMMDGISENDEYLSLIGVEVKRLEELGYSEDEFGVVACYNLGLKHGVETSE